MQPALRRLDHLTFKGNLRQTRYGWLRLTPAYSVNLVAELLDNHGISDGLVLDPFCGTGTTALVCAERGIVAKTTDINPFLLWLTSAKTRPYSPADLDAFQKASAEVAQAMRRSQQPEWIPAIHQIEKWWSAPTLAALGRAMASLRNLSAVESSAVTDLLKVAFCRMMIERANVSFGHQSMSFKKSSGVQLGLLSADEDMILESWRAAVRVVAEGAASDILVSPQALLCDSRDLRAALEPNSCSCVITSPPYPNRMSYIRELRPYMYWLGYLGDGRAAGELDWQAIGGTWGSATSKLAKWEPPQSRGVPFDGFQSIVAAIATKSPLLSRYVHKYFYDMTDHCESLHAVVKPGGTVHYIVGNSKFYDVMLPVERIFACLFDAAGFEAPAIKTIRKRTSKKELFEFVVSARKPSS
jgi:hypothetical protein